MKKRIVVTQKDIDETAGRIDWEIGNFCPVERAFRRAGFLGTTTLEFHRNLDPEFRIPLPERVIRWIENRDENKKGARPFSFTVEVPE